MVLRHVLLSLLLCWMLHPQLVKAELASQDSILEQPLPCRPAELQQPACRVRIVGREVLTLPADASKKQPLGRYTLPQVAREVWVHESLVLVTLSPRGLVVLAAVDPGKMRALVEIGAADITGLFVDASRALIRLRLASGEWQEVALPDPTPEADPTSPGPEGTTAPSDMSLPPSSAATGSSSGASLAATPSSTLDYRLDGVTLRIFASSAPDALELGATRLAGNVRKLVSFQGLLAVSYAPAGLAILDASEPKKVLVVRYVSELDVRQLELVGSVLRYSTVDGERNEFYLPKLLGPRRMNRTNANRAPSGEKRCIAATSADPAGPLQVQSESSLLIIRERRKQGLCWHGSLTLPSPAEAIMPHGSAVYIATKGGALLVIDLAQPALPKLVQNHNTFCTLETLRLSSAKDELLITTAAKQDLRFAIADPLAPQLISKEVVASCRTVLNQVALFAVQHSESDSSSLRPATISQRPAHSTTKGQVLFGVGLGVFGLSYLGNIYVASGGKLGYLVPGAPFALAVGQRPLSS